MLLKRLYDEKEVAAFREGGERPAPLGIRVLRAGAKQHFSPNFIEEGSAQGWLSMAKGKITIEAENGAVIYALVRGPGVYCCHCGAVVDDSEGARVHLEAKHMGEKSPDPQNPAGYCRIHYYDCVKEG